MILLLAPDSPTDYRRHIQNKIQVSTEGERDGFN